MDVAGEKREELKRPLGAAFPEIFAEGKIDFDQLKRILGEWVEPGKERFSLNWPGKAECIKIIQQPSVAALKPVRAESVDFDTTENLFIEGDNLEVLKLLQKSYFSKVKLIYIDPPYNTGNEFIYPDKYAETLETYLAYTGQVDDGGRKFSTNTDASGRFRSRWLNMMYPRLYLARNLLREDGAIFMSISDHELSSLRQICDLVFGEENFVAQLVWKSRKFPDSRSVTQVSTDHEYIVVYRRSEEALFRGIGRDETKFKNPDNDARGLWMSRSILGLATADQRPNLHYPIKDPATGMVFEAPANRGWRYSKERMQKLISEGRILFPKDSDGRPREKKFKPDLQSEYMAFPSIIDDVFTSDGTEEVRRLFGAQVFDFPKPSELMRRLVEQLSADDDIVLDFFAGSGSLAHGVMLQNQKDEGRRRWIMIQLPEACDDGTEAAKLGYKTIAEIGKERIRRAAAQIASGEHDQLHLDASIQPDNGFKALKLDRSNFKVWNGGAEEQEFERQIELHIDHLLSTSSAEDVLYELLLKAGFQLTTKIRTAIFAGKSVFSIEGGSLLICLEKKITPDLIDALADANPLQVICLDEAFKGNDQLKANAVQTFRGRALAEESEIVFRTV
jgi:adenine-specific DNA-methyltransferase